MKRNLRAFRVGVISVLAVLAGLPPFPSVAQTTLDEEELWRRIQREAEERAQQQQAPRVRLQPAPAIPEGLDLPAEAECFPIDEVHLQGDRLEQFKWLGRYLAQYAGRCIGREGLNLILKRATGLLLDRGLITTRVGLPEQDLSSRVLKIGVIPGVVRAVRFAEPTPRGVWNTAFPIRPGDLLELRDLEQGLEQMKRLAFQEVNLDLVPGAVPGETDILIKVERVRPWRASLSADDAGSPALGRWQGAAQVAVDNPLGWNDALSLDLSATLATPPAQHGVTLSYSLPWGYWSFALAASAYEYEQSVRGTNESFVSSGDSRSLEFKIQRVLYRDQAHKASLQSRVTQRRSHGFIDDAEILVQRREVTAAELALLHRAYVAGAQFDAALAHRRGVPWFDAQPETASGDEPTTRYRLHTLDVSIQKPFTAGAYQARYLGSLHGQVNQTMLYGSEFIALGNRYTVRGFDGAETLAAERGAFWRNEVELRWGRFAVSPYAGLDIGRVGGASAPALSGTTLAGVVLGARGVWHGIYFDGFAGWPLHAPPGFETARPAMGGQVLYQF
ncbi:MAG: ShlB/FhaC/HecB family hemolysin secretion/activation protein [Pseudomonadota bacterium]